MTTPQATDPMTLSPSTQHTSTGGDLPARRIAKLGVVGAGAMGAGIAALAASANVPVVLLDIPGDEKDRNGPAKAGLERVKKSKPAAFMDPAKAALIRTGNTEDHLELLA